MTPAARPAIPARPQGYLTIQAVIQRSGAHRQTIHYYKRKALLPAPVVTSRTSALYPPETVELIRLIRQYQDRRRLSLEEIAGIFRRHGYEPAPILDELNSTPAATLGAGPYPAEVLLDNLEPPPGRDWIEGLVSDGILIAEQVNGENMFSADSMETARTIWKWTRQGFPLDHFKEWTRVSRSRADADFKQFLAGLRANPFQGTHHPETAHLFDVFQQFTSYQRRQTLRTQLLGEIERALFRFLDTNFRQIFPSETFMARMGLNREIDRLRIRLARRPGDAGVLRNLARAYQLRSDWPRLHEVAMELLRANPKDGQAAADLGRSLMFLGRYEEAHAVLENALNQAPHPLVKLRLGQLLIMLARRSGDPARFLEALRRKSQLINEAFEESRNEPALKRKIRLNAVLERMSTDDPLGLQGPPIEELQRLYREFHALKDAGLSALAKISLVMGRMFTAYALYLVLKEEGRPDAEKYRREILRTDPEGILAAGEASDPPRRPGKPKIA